MEDVEKLAYSDDRQLEFLDVTPTGALLKAYTWLSGWPIHMVRAAVLKERGRLEWVVTLWVDNADSPSVEEWTALVGKDHTWVNELPPGWPPDVPLPTKEEAEEAVRRIEKRLERLQEEEDARFNRPKSNPNYGDYDGIVIAI